MLRRKAEETEFRVTLMEKVRLAKQFNAQEYVKDYLADLHTEMTPRTYQGRSHPTWLVEELMEKEKLDKRRAQEEQLDIMTQEPLVRPGETVQEFEERMRKRKI